MAGVIEEVRVLVVLILSPGVRARSVTEIAQDAPSATEPVARVKVVSPAVGAKLDGATASQVLLMAGTAATSSPAGRASLKPMVMA